MKTLQLDLAERSYPIYIGRGLLQQNLLSQHISSKQVMIVSNKTVAPLYLQTVVDSLSGYQVETVILADGEQYKTLETTTQIFDALLTQRFSRNCTIIALGGGVVGDITGFAAACYQRGVAFIQIPTTVLAQVDSSVGGKTGVNHPLGKNMIGAFYQPQCVLIDIEVLKTLDDRQFSAGLAEVIKYGLIDDAEFFGWLEENLEQLLNRDQEALIYAIEKSCLCKAEVVAKDEKESGLRAILNLGHTFGHAIETGMGYGEYLHGEAVAIGTCQAADLSQRLAYIDEADVQRIITIFQRCQLPVTPPKTMGSAQFIELMTVDKKNMDGKIRLILLESIGKATLPLSIDIERLTETLQDYGR